jgi:hypothetical protein
MSTAPGQAGTRWWEEVRPQVSVVVIFFVLLLVLSLQNRVTDPDYWWHLRTGQWILEEGRIPYTDPFSFTAQGQPWIAHSWLAEIFMYLLYRYVGAFSLPLLRSLLQIATLGLLFKMTWERWPRLGGSIALILVTFFASARFWLARPNSVSLALAVVVLYLWYLYKWRGRDRLWLLPPLFALWANLHSGFIYGLFLLGALFVGELLAGRLWSDPVRLERRRWLRLGLFSLLSVVAVLLNPYHVRLLLYPFTYYFGGITLHTGYVGEWLSPNFHEFSNMLFALLLLVLIAGLAWRRSSMGPAETLALLLFLGLALTSIRAAGIAIPLLAWSTAGVLGQGVAPRTSPGRGAWRQPTKTILALWYGGTLLLVLVLLIATGFEFATWGRDNGFQGEDGYPRQAVDALARLPASARMFNSYDWGGYLIWRLYPERLVFMDGRADLYGDALFTDYLQVWQARPRWAEVLSRYDVDVVLCESQGSLAAVLTASSSWQIIHVDDMAAVFRRIP